VRSCQINWRIEAKIPLVRVYVILTKFFYLCFSPVIFSMAFTQKGRALIRWLAYTLLID
jgi:hypothetical protein